MRLSVLKKPLVGEVELPISKSIANRDLIIAAIAKQSILLPEQLPEDVRILQASLKSNATEVNVGMAGTAMRFLAAYFSAGQNNEVLLTGNQRMKQRPIGLLVDALKDIGADVSYTEKNGFPPLKIKGLDLAGGEVQISTEVSSQFVSALMLIAPSMKNGLTIRLVGKVLSKPYIQLTATCMRNAGVNVEFYADRISIPKGKYQVQNVLIEADWSSASYLYALACVKPGSKLLLRGLKLNSPQGDTVLADWFKPLGVTSIQKETGVEISSGGVLNYPKEIDFSSSPDLAQTFAFLTAALGEKLKLTGLDNLRLKETDRISALKTELEKLGVLVFVDGNEMTVSGLISVNSAPVKTYNDHRMAMSAAVLSSVIPIEVENPDVVAKSFPAFWQQIAV